MGYTALYRKFRPGEFKDVKGQDVIVRILRNQIKTGRIGHAYLFCGTRGTGKTTVAKIFAKAVNCEHPVDGSPCGECEMCQSISAGTSMNVIEVDAASNNGVDNIRRIREEVAYHPTEGKYKVYIIDEAHMISDSAFNALLKTLEEPPEYVIFILATTEARKIPVTILSRCQRFDFKRISIDTICGRLNELIAQEGLEVEEKAVRYIARAADGAMRDALSLLEQCVTFYLGQQLTYDHVLDVLGAVDTDVFSRLFRELITQDVKNVISSLDELMMQGRELTQFSEDFVWYLRNLLLIQSSEHVEDALDVSTESLQQLKEEAGMIETEELIRYIRIFSKLTGELKYATQKRVLVEVTFIKLCRPQMETGQEDALLSRIRALENMVEQKIDALKAGQALYAPQAEPEKKPEKPRLTQALSADVREVAENFRSITGNASVMLRQYLKKAHLSAGENDRLQIVLPDEVSAGFVAKQEHKDEIIRLIEEKTGKTMEIDVRQVEKGRVFEDQFVDIEKLVNMDITVED